MYSVYILRSLRNGDVYVGSCADVEKRFAQHNAGRVRSTKGYRPWELIEVQWFETRGEAVKQELFLKTGQQKEKLKTKYMA